MLGQIVDSLTRELMTYQYFFGHSLSIPQGSRHTNRNGLSILQLPLSSEVPANGMNRCSISSVLSLLSPTRFERQRLRTGNVTVSGLPIPGSPQKNG